MNHIMIDLETIGTRPGAAILTIGAVRFSPTDTEMERADPLDLPEDRAFYKRIDRESCTALGLSEDADTLAWWERQNPEARWEAFEATPRQNISEVMAAFSHWCGENPYPWSHGASFDVVLCEAILERLGMRIPWKFCNIRDTRTLYAYAGTKLRHTDNHHHALFDATAQAIAVQQAYALKR